MSYTQQLSLPRLLKESVQLPTSTIGYSVIPDSTSILTDEALACFDRANLEVFYSVLFVSPGHGGNLASRLIHTDASLMDKNGDRKSSWRKTICSINWELTNSIAEWHWWDLTSLPILYPKALTLPPMSRHPGYEYLSGIHYGNEVKVGIPDGAKLIQTAKIDSIPTLVRTDVPHNIAFVMKNPAPFRAAISIRFKESWQDWDEALIAFDSLK